MGGVTLSDMLADLTDVPASLIDEAVWNSSITTWSMRAFSPSRRAMFATISAVAAMIGAEPLTVASPVIMPTFSAPKISQSEKNFSLTSALIGAV